MTFCKNLCFSILPCSYFVSFSAVKGGETLIQTFLISRLFFRLIIRRRQFGSGPICTRGKSAKGSDNCFVFSPFLPLSAEHFFLFFPA